jgi:hypothetical protein
MSIEEIKAEIAKQEKALSNPKLFALMGDKIQAKVDSLKAQLSTLEGKAETKVEDAEKKVEEAVTKDEKKDAKQDLAEAKEEKKEVANATEKVEKVEKKVFVAGVAEVKAELAKQEKALSNPKLFALMGDKIQAKVDGLKKQLEQLEGKAETKGEKKEVEKLIEKADKVEKIAEKKVGGLRVGAGRKPIIGRMERPKGSWGGTGRGAGRKKKASSMTKMVIPEGVKVVKLKRKAKKSKAKAVPEASMSEAKSKTKSVRAFGQTVTYKNDAEFCSQLIKAFKKRRLASKKDGKRRKTKPVFGVIATSVKNAVSKALHSVSTTEIQKNPKQFLAKATRLEKSAIRFLEDFKSILGSDYKKSEITSEFGELEVAIKQFVAKYTKKK